MNRCLPNAPEVKDGPVQGAENGRIAGGDVIWNIRDMTAVAASDKKIKEGKITVADAVEASLAADQSSRKRRFTLMSLVWMKKVH